MSAQIEEGRLGLPEPQEVLVQSGKWITHTAWRLHGRMPWAEVEDMVQTGVLTALELRERYDPARGVPFPIFIKPRVLGAMIDISRKAGSIKRREEAYIAGSETVTPDDALEQIIGCESAEILAEEIDKLPEEERTAISLFYLEELRNKEVAGIMGVSEVRVVRCRARALSRLAASLRQRTNMTDSKFEETAGERS